MTRVRFTVSLELSALFHCCHLQNLILDYAFSRIEEQDRCFLVGIHCPDRLFGKISFPSEAR